MTLLDIAPWPPKNGGLLDTAAANIAASPELLWTLLAATAALAACLVMAARYRRTNVA